MAAPKQLGSPAVAPPEKDGGRGKAPAGPTPPAGPAPTAAAPAPDPAAAIRALRRRRARTLAVRVGAFVVLPTALAGAYYGALASDQFESDSQFTVYSATKEQASSLGSIIGTAGMGAPREIAAVREYILSRDMLTRLDKEQGYIATHQGRGIDWGSRLRPGASFEDAFEYYRSHVRVDVDVLTGMLTLRVRAFAPERAQTYAKAILVASEEMVNSVSEKARVDKTKYAQEELTRAEARYQKARQELTRLQKERGVLDPAQTAIASIQVKSGLEAELARARADLMQARSFMMPGSPKVVALEERVGALSAQVAAESVRMVSPKSEKGLDSSIAEFEAAQLEKEFAQNFYQLALTALEQSRIEASQQHRYLATVVQPSAPDETTHPKRVLSVVTVFVASFLLMGIAWLLASAVKEHARL